MDSLINDFSELSITNNNNFNDEVNSFMNSDINHLEKYNFPNALIYGFKKIGDNENNFFYIGSSVNFYSRFIQHLSDSKKENTKLYDYIIKIGGWKNIEKYIIEKFPCNDIKKELTTREQFYINIFETNKKCNTDTAKADINDHNYYHNSFIYKFINKISGELLYIGSTNQDITCRIYRHKSYIRNINNERKNKNGEINKRVSEKEKIMYKKIKNEIGMENIEFIVMNKIKCEDEYELHEIENQYIKFYDPLLNSSRSEPEEEYKNTDLIDINIIINRKNFP